jgi:hypothetical protein
MTESAARQRPRQSLLVILGIAAIALLVYWAWPSASPAAGPSNQARSAGTQQRGAPSEVPHVDVAKLKEPKPEASAERNPFRFQPKAPPAPPPPPPTLVKPPVQTAPDPNAPPPPPPPPPPIPLKFIGTLEGRGPGKVAIFSDGRGLPQYGKEGDVILGQYKIVRIGVESVVMEYADGRGRQTIPLRGQ